MKCAHCGKLLSGDALFCAYCGASTDDAVIVSRPT